MRGVLYPSIKNANIGVQEMPQCKQQFCYKIVRISWPSMSAFAMCAKLSTLDEILVSTVKTRNLFFPINMFGSCIYGGISFHCV